MKVVRHPTGFIKVVVGMVLGRELRVHIWPRGHQGVDADVHDHRCRFVSVPFWGRFLERRYRARPGEDCEIISCANNGEILESGGRGSVEFTGSRLRRAFVPYFCGLNRVHSFEPLSSGLHMTLVVFGRRHKARARVFRPAVLRED